MNPIIVNLKNVVKCYGDNCVVKNLNMEILEGEFLSILGPSGCGKTTTLRMIAGFEQQTEGIITVEGERVENKEPFERNVNTVFQNYALFPHMTVFDNIAFGLKMKRVKKGEIREMVMEALSLVQMESFSKRYPSQLSGGQKQRVAIARAVVNRPKVLLLDEPLGALDMKLRKQMQIELKRLQKHLGITFVYVTHDQEEALTMSDRIAVMNGGVLEQLDAPSQIYERPRSKFVADFIGESNLWDAVAHPMENGLVALTAESGNSIVQAEGFVENELVNLSIRPEKTRLSTEPVEGFTLCGVVKDTIYIGNLIKSILVLPTGHEIKVNTLAGNPIPSQGSRQYIYWEPEDAVLMHSVSNTIFTAVEDVDYGQYVECAQE
ncbi:ABC transporter ATP-binding protein [Oscillospiraceae bacterium MB08-C2-2]|nr:ABC transporter ATP-binding protein [Oscillospiraceae bacterium MB08-C2-2]